MKTHFARWAAPLAGLSSVAHAITLDLTSQDSIKSVTSTLAYDMMTYYSGNQSGQVPGLLPGPCASTACYYWWEAGAMFGSLINYWQYTGDTSYNPTVSQALQFQVGPEQNFNPPNQSKNMGIDDQLFWAFSAMDAAEADFPNPASNQPSWLALAQAVFNFQSSLWDPATCNGGFRWQVYSFNAGYNLKNTISNGGNFQLAARLARYTGNQTYADWAEKVWDWVYASELITYQGSVTLVHDNTDVDNGCSDNGGYYWTYNYGTLLVGAAYMYNYTNGNATWGARVQTLLDSSYTVLYPTQYGGGNIVVEVCEPSSGCDNDQSSFKAYWSRWLAVTAQLAPFTYDQIMPKMALNAAGAAAQCTGGSEGRACGREWYTTTWDGTAGVGQQMSALSVIGANLLAPSMAPLTKDTGGTSKGDPNAGTTSTADTPVVFAPITTADRAGAGILTMLAIVSLIALSIWIIL